MSELKTVEGKVERVSVPNNGLMFIVDGKDKWYNSKDFKVQYGLKGAIVRLLNVADDKDFESLEIIQNPSEEQQLFNKENQKRFNLIEKRHFENIVSAWLIKKESFGTWDQYQDQLKKKSEELRKHMRG